MMTHQRLSTGEYLWQDFSASVRPVFFETDYEEWRYGTNGGTLFVVELRQHVFALTCAHVFKGFRDDKLFIFGRRIPQKGARGAPVKGMASPSSPAGEAEGTDATDLCAIEFADDIDPNFFCGTAYRLDPATIGTSRPGHQLQVAGFLKDKTALVPSSLVAGYCCLKFVDNGRAPFDPFLRQGLAEFPAPGFDNLTGLSGAPVFDVSANTLCGMVCRAGMVGTQATLHYFDIFDIVKFLEAAASKSPHMTYDKNLSS